MPDLVALAVSGPTFVARLQAAWDAGHAVLPLDPRLPRAVVEAVLAGLRPSRLIDASGEVSHRAGSRPVEDGDALVVATSGTTGDPKGVVLTHDAVRASALATSARLEVDPDRDVWLACLPMAHMGGLSVVTRALITGTTLVVHPGFDAAAVQAAPADEGVTLVSLVATALGRVDASVFRTVVLGGSAPPASLPANVVTTYGLTETGSGVVYDGRPLEGVEVRIDADTGEIAVRGSMLLRCYRDGRDPKDAEGWLATGDSGRVDGHGHLLVDGRLSEVIITGGQNVWPAAVEAVLADHPSVAEVRVTGAPDPEWGERVVATIVPAAGTDGPALEELRAWGRERLPPYALPRQVELATSLDRTTSGKLRRTGPVPPA